MKKIIIAFIIIIACTPSILAQEEDSDGLKGTFFIEPYAGLINPGRIQLGSIIREKNSTDSPGYSMKAKQIGIPVILGTKLEYMLTDVVGLGLDFNYQESGFESEHTYETYDYLTANYKDTTVRTEWNEQKLRIMGRFQAHFGNHRKVDMYVGGSAGIGLILNRNDNYYDNRPDIGEFDVLFIPIKIMDYGLKDAGLPIALRGYFGARIMFADNIGMLTEVGIGSGSLINLGLTIKL